MAGTQKQESKIIKYSDLPEEVQYSVSVILNHRKQIRRTTSAFSGFSASLTAAGGILYKLAGSGISPFFAEDIVRIPAFIVVPGIAVVAGGRRFWVSHDRQFGKEYSWLFKTLGENKNNPKLEGTLGLFNYFKVTNKGDLVGSNTAPVISKRFPVGRRRVVSPFADPKIIEKWKKEKIPAFIVIDKQSKKISEKPGKPTLSKRIKNMLSRRPGK